MTAITFVCRHCKKEQKSNPRLKGRQEYCSKPACQKARRASWKRAKMLVDPIYAESHRAECAQWRQRHPKYWQTHRQSNPKQTERNRLLQRSRNTLRRRRLSDKKIAKVDAFQADPPEKLPKNGAYWLVPLIAKVDALKVNLEVIAE